MMPDACIAPLASIERLHGLLEVRMGLRARPEDERFLRGAVERMARERGVAPEACLDWLVEGGWDEDRLRACARFFTVPETYFYRDPHAFDLLAELGRRLHAEGRPVRVWSAGCCTGEEAYSAAMALADALPAAALKKVTVLATDINRDSLERARTGVYGAWSFRGRERGPWRRHVEALGDGSFRVADSLRGVVAFRELNLALPAYPSAANGTTGLDLILCRNVLLYFSDAQRRKVVARLWHCLAPGGWLVVGPAEAGLPMFAEFEPVIRPGGTCFRKAAAGPAPGWPGARIPAAPAGPAPVPAAAAGPARAPVETARPHARDARAAGEAEGEAARLEELRIAAAAAIESGRNTRARALLQQLLYLAPDDILAQLLSAQAYLEQGRSGPARRHFMLAAVLLDAHAAGSPVPGGGGLPPACLRAAVQAHIDRLGEA